MGYQPHVPAHSSHPSQLFACCCVCVALPSPPARSDIRRATLGAGAEGGTSRLTLTLEGMPQRLVSCSQAFSK